MAEEFVDKRFYRIQEEYFRNTGNVKLTPEKIIIDPENDDLNMVILEGCYLLENKIGKITLQCKTKKFCMSLEECEPYVIKNPTPITFEIENKYLFKRYVVSYPDIITNGSSLAKIRFYDIIPAILQDEYDTPECLETSCTAGKGVYKPGELWTKKSLKPKE